MPQLAERDGRLIPAGGFGSGHFAYTDAGEFRCWRIHPGLPERDEPVHSDCFHVWARQGSRTTAVTLSTSGSRAFAWRPSALALPVRHVLFPLTWRDYPRLDLPIRLQSLSFSPMIAGSSREPSLPVYTVLWRALNHTAEPVEVALMLTWACGWPELLPRVDYDMQHDNLCITGSLGDVKTSDRMGIAVPDLHSEGIYQQGIENWNALSDGTAVWDDFADDGELDPAVVRGESPGAAAWVKFDLAPGEAKEVPFVIVWHFPVYESGPAHGQPRYYTQFLEKRRPDNAVVWLAEEVVQNFGQETANWRYWLYQIRDWHRGIEEDSRRSSSDKRRELSELSAILDADSVLPESGRLVLLPRSRHAPQIPTRAAVWFPGFFTS